MTLAEKIAQTPKLERIDSSIESCIKILEEELIKRKALPTGWEIHSNLSSYLIIGSLLEKLDSFKDDFNVMKGKK